MPILSECICKNPYCGRKFEAKTSEIKRGQHKYCSRNCFYEMQTGTREFSGWEVDWSHEGNSGTNVWARNPKSKIPRAREWGFVKTGYLRNVGINTPTYRKDSWEVDWSKRDGKKVWARNPASKMPGSKKWHWISHKTLDVAGVPWKPFGITGRSVDAKGYVHLTRRGMTNVDIQIANDHNLWKGSKKSWVSEHQLEAVKKYGCIPAGSVVRHFNGIKSDNSWNNLLLGTSQENTMDHNTARLMAMYWRERYEICSGKLDVRALMLRAWSFNV